MSAARRAASRANARLSTGPSSASGKARVAQNARRHGLSVPIAADPQLAPLLHEAATALAGADASAARLAAAARVAAAQLDLQRIRRAREQLLRAPIPPPCPDVRIMLAPIPTNDPEQILRAVAAWQDWQPPPPDAPELHEAIALRARQLRALDRYERRAVSARKRAIRALDALPQPDPTALETEVAK